MEFFPHIVRYPPTKGNSEAVTASGDSEAVVMSIACGVDIGTNSFRLLVAEVEDGHLRPLAQDLVTVRLGEGLGATGRLGPAALMRAEAALSRFATLMGAYPVRSVRACATHAVRKAANREEFLQPAECRIGVRVEVLSGEEEARLALLGALSALPEERRRYPLVLVDVGGGSSEIILQAMAGSEPRVMSLPLGAVGLSEDFDTNYDPMREKIRAILAPALRGISHGMTGQDFLLVASGGTATSLAALALGLKRYDAHRVQNYNLSQAALHGLVARLAALSPGKRNALPGLGDGRGEIIVAGAMILQELQHSQASPMLVSDAGLLEGILLSGVTGALLQTRH